MTPYIPSMPSLAGLLFESLRNPERTLSTCFVDTQTSRALFYHDILQESATAAGVLSWLGVRVGDTVSIMLEHGMHFVIPWFGALRMGAVLNPIGYYSFYDRQRRIAEFLERVGPRALIVEAEWAFEDTTKTMTPLFRAIREKLPHTLILIVSPNEKNVLLPSDCGAYTYCWNSFCKTVKRAEREFCNVVLSHSDMPCEIVSDDGNTTKTFTHAELVTSAVTYAFDHDLRENDRMLIAEPLADAKTHMHLGAMLYKGGTTVVSPLALPYTKDMFFHQIERRQITCAPITSLILRQILLASAPWQDAGGRVRFFVEHAGTTDDLRERFTRKTGITVD